MNSNERSALSRTLSKILRHKAVDENLTIRSDGFINLAALLARPKLRSLKATFERVQEVVEKDNKTRFTLREESGEYWIRANQGHSIVVDDLEVTEIVDPHEFPSVVHGTYLEAWKSIETEGLKRQRRNHIHLASGLDAKSGVRKNCQVFIYIDLVLAMKDDIKFYISSNGVILTEGNKGTLLPKYFSRVEDETGNSLIGPLSQVKTNFERLQLNEHVVQDVTSSSSTERRKAASTDQEDYGSRDLYGGHMTTLLPVSWLDASEFRQVPDTQEVFLPPTSDSSSLIIELVEPPSALPATRQDDINFQKRSTDSVSDPSLNTDIRRHFQTLAEDNDAIDFHISESHASGPDGEARPTWILMGTQTVNKFNSKESDTVFLILGLTRLLRSNTDILVSHNAITKEESDVGKNIVLNVIRNLKVVDWTLFPECQ